MREQLRFGVGALRSKNFDRELLTLYNKFEQYLLARRENTLKKALEVDDASYVSTFLSDRDYESIANHSVLEARILKSEFDVDSEDEDSAPRAAAMEEAKQRVKKYSENIRNLPLSLKGPEQWDEASIREHVNFDDFNSVSLTTRFEVTRLQPALEFLKQYYIGDDSQTYCDREMDGIIKLKKVGPPFTTIPTRPVQVPFDIVHFTSNVKYLEKLQPEDIVTVKKAEIHCHTDLWTKRWCFSLETELRPGTATHTYQHLKPFMCEITPEDEWVGIDEISHGNERPFRKVRHVNSQKEFYFQLDTDLEFGGRLRSWRVTLQDGTKVRVPYVDIKTDKEIKHYAVPCTHQARVFIRAESYTTMKKDGGEGGYVLDFNTTGGKHVCLPVGTVMRFLKKEKQEHLAFDRGGSVFTGTNYFFKIVTKD